jgi:colanic acid/amylovoran biosynthesis glycosyltransferase
MRIAFIVPEFPSLSQTFVLNQITGLLDRGHDVEIFSATAPRDEKYHCDVLTYKLLDRTTYFPKIPDSRLRRALKGSIYALSRFAKYPKIVIRSMNLFKFGKLAASFTLMHRINPFLGKAPFDIIHCHFGPMGIIGVQCLRTGALKGKIVTTFHGYDLTSYTSKHGPNVYRTLFEHGDLYLPISNHWKNRLIDIGCKKEKIAVHRMGVDVQQFHDEKKVRPPDGSIKILSVARLVEKKGIQYGIEAISKVLQHFSKIEYVIAGDGPLRSQLEGMIKQRKLEDHIRLLGWMNQDEINELMRKSDILLAPSVTARDGDQEGIPVVLMEALAMGLPVISTYHSGIPELIIDGKTGFLVEERDSAGLADKLISIINSEPIAMQLKTNGIQYINKYYNIKKLVAELEAIYAQLVSI